MSPTASTATSAASAAATASAMPDVSGSRKGTPLASVTVASGNSTRRASPRVGTATEVPLSCRRESTWLVKL